MALKSINPATGELLESFTEQSPQEAATAAVQAHEAFQAWSQRPLPQRAGLLHKAAAILRGEKNIPGAHDDRGDGQAHPAVDRRSREMRPGLRRTMPTTARPCSPPIAIAGRCRRQLRALRPAGRDPGRHAVEFPLLAGLPLRRPGADGRQRLPAQARLQRACAAPRAIEEIFRRAGFPEHVFTALRVGADQVEALVALPQVRAVTLTGSDAAGRAVAAAAGRHLKKVVLELGGSDPFIVLADAPLAKCVAAAVSSRMINNGQSCIAAKRFIVVKDVYGRFQKAFVAAVAGSEDRQSPRRKQRPGAAGPGRPAGRAGAPGPAVGQARRPRPDRRRARSARARVSISSRRSWTVSSPACRPTTRNCSGPWPP